MITFHRACRIIKDFKEDYLSSFQHRVRNDNLNPRAKKTLSREQKLLQIMQEFDSLAPFEQGPLSVQYCFKFGTADLLAELSDDSDFISITVLYFFFFIISPKKKMKHKNVHILCSKKNIFLEIFSTKKK